MSLRDTPHIKRVLTVTLVQLPDRRPKRILIVETDLALNLSEPGYDAPAVSALMNAIFREVRKRNIDEIEIVPVSGNPHSSQTPRKHGNSPSV